jgi:hypothetical protein
MEPYCFLLIKTKLKWLPLKQGAFLLPMVKQNPPEGFGSGERLIEKNV